MGVKQGEVQGVPRDTEDKLLLTTLEEPGVTPVLYNT